MVVDSTFLLVVCCLLIHLSPCGMKTLKVSEEVFEQIRALKFEKKVTTDELLRRVLGNPNEVGEANKDAKVTAKPSQTAQPSAVVRPAWMPTHNLPPFKGSSFK